MDMVLTVSYCAACTIIACYGLRALYRMSPRTPHVRRAAFIAMTLGAAIAYLEAFGRDQHVVSALFIAAGICLLLISGVRQSATRQDRRRVLPALRDLLFHR